MRHARIRICLRPCVGVGRQRPDVATIVTLVKIITADQQVEPFAIIGQPDLLRKIFRFSCSSERKVGGRPVYNADAARPGRKGCKGCRLKTGRQIIAIGFGPASDPIISGQRRQSDLIIDLIVHPQTGVERFSLQPDIGAVIGELPGIVGVDLSWLDRTAEIATRAAIETAIVKQTIIVGNTGREKRWLTIICLVVIGPQLSRQRPATVIGKAARERVGLLLADLVAIIEIGIFAAIFIIAPGSKGGDGIGYRATDVGVDIKPAVLRYVGRNRSGH